MESLGLTISILSLVFGSGALVKLFSVAKILTDSKLKIEFLEKEIEDLKAVEFPSLDSIKLAIVEAVKDGNAKIYDRLNNYVSEPLCGARMKKHDD